MLATPGLGDYLSRIEADIRGIEVQLTVEEARALADGDATIMTLLRQTLAELFKP